MIFCGVCVECERGSSLDVWSSPSNAHAFADELLSIVTDMLKGQGCHFVPCGCLFRVVRQVASEDEVKERRRQVTGGQPHYRSKVRLSNKAWGCHLQPEI
ncbi:hypothetical protein XENORESO_012489 [Xenotaenia resolanae]|uniref:Uncharacterized protein n=1 Tax=Xenotaenia resolanae TaxID=208358 RepID=A0ABV0VYX7_9TELE